MKPKCKLSGQNGNIFSLMGIASRALKDSGLHDQAMEMAERISTEAESYYKAIAIISEYVEVE